MKSDAKSVGFKDLGIAEPLLDVIASLDFKIPTPIQQKAIPVTISGRDVLGIAQTGTGKTLAFGVPMIQLLKKEPAARALILVPTRELALQVDEVLRKLGNPFDIRSVIVVGGMDMTTQVKLLKKETIRVIIATPGRLLDHLEQKTFDANALKMVVIDEADRMLDMGFSQQVKRIAPFLPTARQTLLFSATISDAIMKIAEIYMDSPERVEVSPSGTAPEKIIQELCIVHPDDKPAMLTKVLEQFRGSVLIFTRTKALAWKLAGSLKGQGISVNELHSDRSQGERRHALQGFKTGLYRVLVATDIAARGIDVHGVQLVINYDLPDETENYIHRIGRTGRAGREGHAITFATPYEGAAVLAIENLMKSPLKVVYVKGISADGFFTKSVKTKKSAAYEDVERHSIGRPQYKEKTSSTNTPNSPNKRKK